MSRRDHRQLDDEGRPLFGRSREESRRAGLAQELREREERERAARDAVADRAATAEASARGATRPYAELRRAWFGLRDDDVNESATTVSVDDEDALAGVRTLLDAGGKLKSAAGRRRALRAVFSRRRIKLKLGIAALVVVLGAIGYAIYAVPRLSAFDVQHVTVVGTDAVPDSAVYLRAQSLLRGHSVFALDTSAIEHRIEQIPFVYSARVHTHFPNGVEISIQEYRPLAVGVAGTKTYLVASDGRVLGQVRLQDWSTKIPVIRFDTSNIGPGQNVGSEPALALLRAVPANYPLAIRRIDLTVFGLEATFSDGVQAVIGSDALLHQKMRVLARLVLLYDEHRVPLKYVDVTVPARPATMVG